MEQRIKDNAIWAHMTKVIDIVQTAQMNHHKVDWHTRQPVDFSGICSDWLYRMQEIRSRFV